nr:LMBR1 domain containing protein 2 [Hymenolepis microstoma]
MSYADSGEFTVLRKFRSAVVDNAIIYGTYLLIFVCVMIYLFVKRTISFNVSALKLLLITTSNTWGLFLVILFLGYGLVEVPRSIYRFACPDNRLRFAYFTLSKRYLEYIEDEEELKTVLAEIHDLDQHVGPDHPLRSRFNIIVAKVMTIGEIGAAIRPNRRGNLSENSGASISAHSLTLKRLVKLHNRLKRAYHHCSRARALWIVALQSAADAEDVFNNCIAGSFRVFEHGPTPAVLTSIVATPKPSNMCARLTGVAGVRARSAEWYWKCKVEPLLLKIVAFLLAAASFLIVWSECTFFVRNPRLSIIAAILHSRPTILEYNLVSFVCFLFLDYLAFCVCFATYRLRFFNYYRVVPNHHSDAISLIFYGSMLCRLFPSLCVNFLCLAHLDSHVLQNSTLLSTKIAQNSTASDLSLETLVTGSVVYETAFTKFMGHLDVVSFIANGFNVYFPMVVVVLCLVTFFSLGSRLLVWFGMPQLLGPSFIDKRSGPVGGTSPVEDAVEDGRMLLYRERTLGRARRRNRGENGGGTDISSLRGVLQKRGTPIATLPSVESEEDMRIDETFGPDQPIVEFSEEKMNAMFEFDLPGRQGGSTSRSEYTTLGGGRESQPLVSKVVSSINRLFQPR